MLCDSFSQLICGQLSHLPGRALLFMQSYVWSTAMALSSRQAVRCSSQWFA